MRPPAPRGPPSRQPRRAAVTHSCHVTTFYFYPAALSSTPSAVDSPRRAISPRSSPPPPPTPPPPQTVLATRAKDWNNGASAFADAAVAAGSVFASFFVGSVKFYAAKTKEERTAGAALLAKAAVNGSPDAHHTLAIMHFNGSGGRRKDKDPEAGAALCARGNILFNSVPAKRELGHCLQDGFGVERDVALGKKLLAEAAAEDTQTPAIDIAVSAATAAAAAVEERLRKRNDINTLQEAVTASREVSNAARAAAREHLHATPENRFLLDWFNPDVCGEVLPPGMHACSHPLCGRVETRRHEFRRCSCCGRVRYCSRSCQSLDWRLQHKFACLPLLELYGWMESDAESVDGGSVGPSPPGSPGGADFGGASSAAAAAEA